jgi:hypothetical protein
VHKPVLSSWLSWASSGLEAIPYPESEFRNEHLQRHRPCRPGAGSTCGIRNRRPRRRRDGIRWDKGVCRYCGTGCGVLVGVKDGRIVATQGDPGCAGEQGPQLRQGLLPLEDPVRQGPPDHAAAAHEGRQVRQERRVRAGQLEAGLRHHGREGQGRAEGQGADLGRHVRLGPVDHLGGLCRQQAVQGRLPLQQHRPERAPLHGLRRGRLHAHLRRRRADGRL